MQENTREVPEIQEEEKKAMSQEAQMLEELIRLEHNTALWQKVTGIALIGLFVIFGVALLILVPKVNGAVRQMTTTMENVDRLAAEAETALGQVNGLAEQVGGSIDNIDAMVQNVDEFVVANTENVNQAVNNFNDIDFDSLNAAIQDLRDVVEPLANFARRFQ
ncbi:MAG: hypothetical protein IJR36_04345 [Lachnospiraceae bacterium]|nr:hypothetical protein [Lachnospiraceae bacterium]MBQ9563528.1 hypothetical protein [Lachnospiraceae bacterium]MBQ9593088.1 hypothetical protein [Lachnospiraceae bacterium]